MENTIENIKKELREIIADVTGAPDSLRISEEETSLTISTDDMVCQTVFVGDKYEIKVSGKSFFGTLDKFNRSKVLHDIKGAIQPKPLEILEGFLGNLNPTEMLRSGKAMRMRLEYDHTHGDFGFSLALSDGGVMIITGESWKIFQGDRLIKKGSIYD